MSEAPDSLLVVAREEGDDRVLLRFDGEIDAANASILHQAVDASAGAGLAVELDLSGVSFMDSSGLGAIIIAHRRVRDAGGRLLLGPRSPIVDRLFSVSGVEQALAATGDDQP